MKASESSLPSFPSISDQGFVEACMQLVGIYQSHGEFQSSWTKVQLDKVDSVTFMTIQRDIEVDRNVIDADELVDDEFHEHDDHSIVKTDGPTVRARFTIIRSPTYQVPVLYFDLLDQHSKPVTDIADVYRILVPEIHRCQINSIGVIGAISMTSHPITDRPTFFVHPCRTAEALSNVVSNRPYRTLDYLMLWFGIVGSTLGLSIPVELLNASNTA
ncbi:hypothetical protein EJ05DRAFT_344967 [Pseudovirgaria hyperparasitica]|uniref:Ubiquitin-like-conjugating enzyme ATG10 n=1 Tax=Pseudovirgaria hyperparasitica TaxID=470096 RepID=A0A6A6WC30_9PEZI|nr:uncharacterized protein EJ05DRAFT_344967 [Pseudovirgaria hyperparasitica]KAF2759406.1 hypothetical protein EJ05DRAFT_344967 [Pseudovirgaria hyperparasitica]